MPRARRPLLTLLLVALLAAVHLIALPGVPPAGAAGRTLTTLLIGDSYAAGNGAGNYEGVKGCYRSSTNWARLFAESRTSRGLPTTINNQACSGAVTADYWSAQDEGGAGVAAQKSFVNRDFDLVLVSLGGNDAGFEGIARNCFSPFATNYYCNRSLTWSENAVNGSIEANLLRVMRDVRGKVRDDTRIVLMGYPLLATAACAADGVSNASVVARRVRALGQRANEIQSRVVASVRADRTAAGRTPNIDFIRTSDAFSGHEPGRTVNVTYDCKANGQTWIREMDGETRSLETYYHPLPRGHQAYADLLGGLLDGWTPASWTPATGGGGGGSTTPPPANNTPVAKFNWSRVNGTPGKVSLDASNSYDIDGNTTIKSYEWIVGGKVITTGKTASAVFTPGSTVSVTLRVTDNQGASNDKTQSIYLVNRAPTFSGLSPENGHVAGSNQPVLGATATDLDGDTLTYSYRIVGDRVDVPSGATGTQWTVPPSRLDPGAKYTWSVTVSDGTTSVTSQRAISIAMLPVAADVVSTASGQGYWQVASDGGVFAHGDAQFYGSVPGLGLRLTNLMGMARTPSGNGYWVVGSDGGVFSFGDAGFYGSLPGQNIRVNNITGMVPTKSGKGYWLVGTDGGVFSFGDAPFYGSMGGKPLNKPVTAMAATASGGGYWLVARDGGIFSFGDAPFYGSMGGQQLNYPVVDMDVTPDGGGYWLTAEDGGVFSFGNAQFYGSMAGKQLNGHINGMASTPSGKGYWLNGCDGGVFTFGDAPFKGAQSTYQCRGIFYQ